MIVYILSFIACFIGPPNRCELVEVQVNGCSAMGIAEAAEWAGKHPDWKIVAFHGCTMGQEA